MQGAPHTARTALPWVRSLSPRSATCLWPVVALFVAGCGGTSAPRSASGPAEAPPPTLTSPLIQLPGTPTAAFPLSAPPPPELTPEQNAQLEQDYARAMNRARSSAGKEAVPAFAEFVRKYPFHAPAQASLGLSYQSAGDLVRAAEHLGQAARLQPDAAGGWLQYGAVLYQCDRLGDAVQALQQAAQRDLRDDTSRFLLADVLGRMGFLPQSIEYLTQCVALQPTEAGYPIMRAWQRLQSGGNAESVAAAEADFRRGLEINPARAEAHWGIGVCRQRSSDWAGARAALQTAVESGPGLSGAWYALSQTTRKLGDTAASRTALARFHQLHAREVEELQRRFFEGQARRHPGNADARYLLGAWYERQGKRDPAVGAYRDALRLAPGHGPASLRLAALRAGRD